MTEPVSTWTFFTNHAHVLACLANNSKLRIRDVAELVGITERATQRIVADLVDADILRRRRIGRRNIYEINDQHSLRHPIEHHCTVAQMLDMIGTVEPIRKYADNA